MTRPVALLVLSILGAIDAAYLTYAHLFGSAACGDGSSCGAVLSGPYARLLGIPLAGYGLGYYLALVIAGWQATGAASRRRGIHQVARLALVGSVPALGLLVLQGVVIGAWCPFCVASSLLTFAILGIALSLCRRDGSAALLTPPAVRDALPAFAVMVAAPLCVGTLQAGIAGTVPEQKAYVVARIGEREITDREIDHEVRLKLYETRNELRQEWLDRQVIETAAAEEGMDARTFVQQRVYAGIEVTEADIDRRFAEVKDRLPPGVTRASLERNIRNEIGNRKSQAALDAFVEHLKKKYGTAYAVPPSERFSIDPNPRGGPEKGSADAPVTIVEFSDLECGYCARAHAYLVDLLQRRDDIRVVFRHLPLDRHANARFAAEVAACAHRQDRFWPLVDRLFVADELSEATVFGLAREAGVDSVALSACLEAGEGRGVVDADIAEADALGISSTPTFFVNGHYVGSLPRDGLEPVIDRERAAFGASAP